MEIRFISTLTPDDEENVAPALLKAAVALLEQTGIAYTLRIETTSEKVFQHNHPAASEVTSHPGLLGPTLLRPIES